MTHAIARPQFADFAHLFQGVPEETARSRWEALAHIIDSFILEAFGEGHARNAVDDAATNGAAESPLRLEWKDRLRKKFKRAADPAGRKES